mgnify:CR=1 FL=1
MLAGHMLILTFIGLIFVLESLAVAVVSRPRGRVFYLFEVVIVVSIQAFIFAASVRHLHRLGDRAGALASNYKRSTAACSQPSRRRCREQRRAPARRSRLALGIGLGSLGAGIGIGNIFGSMIQAVAPPARARAAS